MERLVPFEDMPHSIAPIADHRDRQTTAWWRPEARSISPPIPMAAAPYPPHWQRLREWKRPRPADAAIHRDLVRIPAIEISERLRSIGKRCRNERVARNDSRLDGESAATPLRAAFRGRWS